MKNAADTARERYEKAKRELDAVERKTDAFLIRLAASPYTIRFLVGAILSAGILVWWLW